MLDLVLGFPDQLAHAIELSTGQDSTYQHQDYTNVLICGMGGSGIAGNIIEEVFSNQLTIPFSVYKGYHLPTYCDKNTLIVLSSYSGNTEEVLSLAKQAVAKNCSYVAITSGGALSDFTIKNNLPVYTIPEDYPPRACLGYSLVGLMHILSNFKLISNEWKQDVLLAAKMLRVEQVNLIDLSKKTSSIISQNTVIVLGEDKYRSAMLRFKQQLNENSKLLCYLNIVPEMNHNELVGWRILKPGIIPVFFRSDDEYARNAIRLDFTSKLIHSIYPEVITIYTKGNTLLERRLYLIHLGDLISCELAYMGGYDPSEIDVLVGLKNHLLSIPISS